MKEREESISEAARESCGSARAATSDLQPQLFANAVRSETYDKTKKGLRDKTTESAWLR